VCAYRHRAHFDPYFLPGLCDLTSFVDFTAVARGLMHAEFATLVYAEQGAALVALGIGAYGADCLPKRAEVQQLTHPEKMGRKFKLIAASRGVDLPPALNAVNGARYL
jgi:SAM-dependent MidA family methyltransferase